MTIEPFTIEHPEESGRRIRGRVETPDGLARGEAVPGVLLVHGFKGFLLWGFFPELSRRLAARGPGAISFNLSGSGVGADLETFDDDEAFERNTYSRELEDIAAVRAAVEHGRWPAIDPVRLAIFGHSRGGGMAILHAAAHPGLRAIATWSAIDSVDRWDERAKEEWRRQGFTSVVNARTGKVHRLGRGLLEDAEAHRERLDIVRAAARITAPALLIHGEADESVPRSALDRIAAAFRPGLARAELIGGAGHTFGARHPLEEVPPELERVLAETTEFFARNLLGAGGGGVNDPP